MGKTIIGWTNMTWNPVTGCSKVSDGCLHCYAETLTMRYHKGWKVPDLPWTAANAAMNVRCRPERLADPYAWKSPQKVFVNSMSDLFHELVPDEYIARCFAVMADLPQHRFQILTKRPERAGAWPGPWAPNIWMGTSVEDRRAMPRIDALRTCGATVRFLSCEPLLGPLPAIDLDGIHWVIVGGESGRDYRWMDHAWARGIRDVCTAGAVPFFFKQSAAYSTERGTSLIEADGSRMFWQQFPGDLRDPWPDDSGDNVGAHPGNAAVWRKSQIA